MATFTAIRCKKQSASSMRGVIDYVEQEKKRAWVTHGWLPGATASHSQRSSRCR